MQSLAIEKILAGFMLSLLPQFYLQSSASLSVKIESFLVLCALASYVALFELWKSAFSVVANFVYVQPLLSATLFLFAAVPLKYLQRKLRYARLNAITMKYGFTHDPATWEDMTVEQAQEIENNLGEWEFPRLWEFAWISDFVRTATDPGVSRALIAGGHMINVDSYIEHERLQATIHAMRSFLSYKIGSPEHSLIISRINEHHHRYGIFINSDDILYLIIHFAFNPLEMVNRWGYRQLQPFEKHAAWVVWREIGVRMGCKYMPKTIQQAKQWRKQFEKNCRWREDANEVAAMAMLNEIIYGVPNILKPLARKLFASVVDWDIVYYCQLEKLGPSSVLRLITYDILSFCGFIIHEFGLPRMSAYKRTPDAPNEKGLINFGHTPYDTMPFYQARNFWNLFGYGALLRRLRGLPMPSLKYQSDGTALEALGAHQITPEAQSATEQKVRENALAMQKGEYGYRSAVGWMNGRFIAPVEGPEYGSETYKYPESTPMIEPTRRFEKQFQRRGPGYSKVAVVEKAEDVVHFDRNEYLGARVNGFRERGIAVKAAA